MSFYPNIWMPEVIEDILKNMTYKQVFEMREINSAWHTICIKLINKGCFEINTKFENAFKYLEKIHSECKFYDEKRFTTFFYQHLLDLTWSYLELIQSEFHLTLACVGRYFSNHQNICVFDSLILDHTAWLISRVYKYPWYELGRDIEVFDPALDRCHSDQYRHFSKLCQLRFNYHIERPINENVTVSGAKIVDILDVLLERPSCPVKTVHLQEYNQDTKLVTYKATYTLYNGWFSRQRLPETEDDTADDFNSSQYFLYVRLVRLVRYHNRFTLEIIHRNRMGRSEFWDDESSPSGITFTGKGDNDSYHYHYGCLNDKMKQIKFRDRKPDIRLELSVTLTSSYLMTSVCLQEYLRSNYRDLDYETRQLHLKLDVSNTFSLLHQAPEEWSIQIS